MKKAPPICCFIVVLVLTACSTVIQPTPYPPQPLRPLAEVLTDLRSADSITSINAAADLWDYGPAAAPAVPDLIAMIDDPRNPYGGHDLDFDNRRTVIDTLHAIGPGAMAAVPTLVRIAQEPQEHVMERGNAIRALGAIGDRSVVPQLIPVLRDPDPGLAREAGLTIERLAQRDFPHDDGHNWQNDAGQAVIAVAVLAWWDAEGQSMDWEHP